MSRRIAAAMLAIAAGLVACVSRPPPLPRAENAEAAGMIDIRTLVPDIDLDIRYAGRNNFVGTRIDGYEAARCYLRRPAAEALARVERSLRSLHLRLRLYDCYRPARAVRHFVAWANDATDQRTKARYYPHLDKRQLLGDYISPTSGHSRGATVDLTLLQCDPDGGACVPLDMGTPFDFFDPAANTDSTRISPAQRRHRDRLRTAMAKAGFRNYPLEWWHFTLDPEPEPRHHHDFVIR